MLTEPGMTRPSVIAISWLAAAAALPLALIGAAVGQGLGAVIGGCHWIGLSVPVERQVWALVNQPVLNFASQPAATGYWLGSFLLPFLVAMAAIGFLPRAQSLVTEIGVVQGSWAMTVVALAWLPMVDPDDGHVQRFLALNEIPAWWVWAAPVGAACVALLPALRLLEMARRRQPEIGRGARTAVVVAHLLPPVAAWIGLVFLVGGTLPVRPTIAVAAPLAAALALAWFRYPSPYVRKLELPTSGEIAALLVAAAMLWAGVWFAGRPLADGKNAGLLWAEAQSFNNIRLWIDAGPSAVAKPEVPSDQK